MPKAISIVKHSTVSTTIDKAIESLSNIYSNSAEAVAIRTASGKKLLAESKKLAKKKATLMKRKKNAANKLKKLADADTRKLLKATEKELTAINKLAAKVKNEKSANSEELAGLKAELKRASSYCKLIEKTDKILNKPAKKRKKKKSTPEASTQ